MSIADTKDFGILRLIVNDADKALEILKEAADKATADDIKAKLEAEGAKVTLK